MEVPQKTWNRATIWLSNLPPLPLFQTFLSPTCFSYSLAIFSGCYFSAVLANGGCFLFFSKIPYLTGHQSQLNILSTLFLPLGNCSSSSFKTPFIWKMRLHIWAGVWCLRQWGICLQYRMTPPSCGLCLLWFPSHPLHLAIGHWRVYYLTHSSPHSWRHLYRILLQVSFLSRSTSLFPNDSDCYLDTSIYFFGHDLDLIVTNNSWKTSLSILLFSDHSLHFSSSLTCQHFFTAPRQLFQPIFDSLPHLLSQLRLLGLTLQLFPCM